MSLRKLPDIRADHRLGAARFDLRPDALERWEPAVRAAGQSDNAISIYEAIGDDWEGQGVTAKRIGAALRAIGPREVVVNVNSPGGDFFEGVAIYNQLRAHPAKVTVQVMGLAASAASVIAMAGDEIQMGEGAFLMIHNAWAVAIGNRHDLAEAAQRLEPFDAAMAQLYAERAGIEPAEASRMMDQETWLGAQAAIELGLADSLLSGQAIAHEPNGANGRKALAMVEAAMAKAGHSRATRRDTLKSLFSSKPGAAGPDAKPSAGDDTAALLHTLITTLKG